MAEDKKVTLNGEESTQQQVDEKRKQLEESNSGTVVQEGDGAYKTRLYG